MTTKSPSKTEREQFEIWVLGFDKTVDLSRYSDEPAYSYRKWATQFAWRSWESARAVVTPSPAPGPWHDWYGGIQPVHDEVWVDVKLRNKSEGSGQAKEFYWGNAGDIIAWRYAAVTPVAVIEPRKEELALNVNHPDCHQAADAFWKHWEENGKTHKHGYYESTWGAINAAIRMVGVVPHVYGVAPTVPVIEQEPKRYEWSMPMYEMTPDGPRCVNPVAVPAIQVQEPVLAHVYFHAHKDDYDVYDRQNFPDGPPSDIAGDGTCPGCVEAVIVRRDWSATPQPEQTAEPIKDHCIAEIVNELRVIAIDYSTTQQLRARIADYIVPHLRAQQRVKRVSSNAPSLTDERIKNALNHAIYVMNTAQQIAGYQNMREILAEASRRGEEALLAAGGKP